MRLTFGALLFALSFSAHAQQQANKLPRLGYLTNDSPSTDLPRRAAFRQGLRDLGYIEGQNIAVEYRVGDGQIEKLSEMMDELTPTQSRRDFRFHDERRSGRQEGHQRNSDCHGRERRSGSTWLCR